MFDCSTRLHLPESSKFDVLLDLPLTDHPACGDVSDFFSTFRSRGIWSSFLPSTIIPQLLFYSFQDSTVRGRPLAVRPTSPYSTSLNTSDAGIDPLLSRSSFPLVRRSRLPHRSRSTTLASLVRHHSFRFPSYFSTNSRSSCSRRTWTLRYLCRSTSCGRKLGISPRMAIT